MWDVLLAPFRARGQAAQLGELTARVHATERALTAVQSVIGELSALQQAQQEHLVAWQRSAEQHLAGLQAGHEALARLQVALESGHSAIARQQAESLRPDALRSIVEWIQSAESHLRALQTDSEHLRSLCERHETQLTRTALLLSSLETRAGDLERADTDIAAAIAREATLPPSK